MGGDIVLTGQVLEELVKSLDISPTDFVRAVDSYTAVADWLIEGFKLNEYPQCNREPDVFPQGSLSLGTIVRPIREGKEADFDVDIVCELKNSIIISPSQVKTQIGSRLKKNQVYSDKLEPEGTRCWTLSYAKSQGIGFHIDVLPSIPDTTPTDIKITHKDKKTEVYSWKYGNPKGYIDWFKKQNRTFASVAEAQKQHLFNSTYREDGKTRFFDSVQKVPEQLVRTPLQRTVQILKRHRDIYFKKDPTKPISIIVTTLSASLYNGETTIYDSLVNITNRMKQFSGYIQNEHFKLQENANWTNLITRYNDNGVWKWWISNPTNKKENFADKWHEDNNARAKSFFKWVEQVSKDMQELKAADSITVIRRLFEKCFLWKITDGVETRLGLKAPAIAFPNVQPKSQPRQWGQFIG